MQKCFIHTKYKYNNIKGTYDINSLVAGREITGVGAFK